MGRVITGQRLVAHPDLAIHQVTVTCDIILDDETLALDFLVEGAIGTLVIPARQPRRRVDGLWRHSCFEAFLTPAGTTDYVEFNFSPSGEWAAYAFTGYRQGMNDLPVTSIASSSAIMVDDGQGRLAARVVLWAGDCPRFPCQLGLSAILEARDGTKSYWALRHPPGPPDFHHPDCFALTLPAPDAA